MVPLQQAIRTLEQIRDSDASSQIDQSLAAALEALLWSMLDQKKKLEEIEAVLAAVHRIVDRLKHDLIVEHNADIDAVSASLKQVQNTLNSIKRVS